MSAKSEKAKNGKVKYTGPLRPGGGSIFKSNIPYKSQANSLNYQFECPFISYFFYRKSKKSGILKIDGDNPL
jgi:hypothetical protein